MLSQSARRRVHEGKNGLGHNIQGNPIEKAKLKKDGLSAFVDVYEYAAKIRAGEMTWEDIKKADLNTRLKFVGMLHRDKRTHARNQTSFQSALDSVRNMVGHPLAGIDDQEMVDTQAEIEDVVTLCEAIICIFCNESSPMWTTIRSPRC